MRCTNKKLWRILSLSLAVLCLGLPLGGCSRETKPEDAFTVDRPGFGIQEPGTDTAAAYYAEDLCVAAEDVKATDAEAQDALAACFFNLDTKEILYAKNIHGRMYPASTTKIMTALLLLEQGGLDDQTTVSKEAITFHESGVTTVKLKEGDVLSMDQLLHALLIVSANDAANVIAEKVGGSVEQFAQMMNEKAASIGATNTHFVNPHGLHDEEHYTTAYDLYLIFNECIKYDAFIDVIGTNTFTASITGADGLVRQEHWEQTNFYAAGLAEQPRDAVIIGGKTGTTTPAGNCLILLETSAQGSPYISVIMGADTKSLLYQNMTALINGIPVSE